MNKLLFTLGFACFFGSFAIAQEPAKVAAKKKSISLTTSNAPVSTVGAEAEMEARVQAKKKYYAEMKAAEAKQQTSIQATNGSSTARKPKKQ